MYVPKAYCNYFRFQIGHLIYLILCLVCVALDLGESWVLSMGNYEMKIIIKNPIQSNPVKLILKYDIILLSFLSLLYLFLINISYLSFQPLRFPSHYITLPFFPLFIK